MKPAAVVLLALSLAAAPAAARAQASAIPTAQTTPPAGTEEQRGRAVLDQMVEALGGDAWIHRHDMTASGHTAQFFRGQPSGAVIDFDLWRRFAVGEQPFAERIGFLTDKSMILPGKKIDIVQIYTAGAGYEFTYKGRTDVPKDQMEDYNRRQNHSIESVIHTWLKTPGVMVLSEGTSMVERHIADKVTVLSPDNDAVTIEIDAQSHLPVRRTFKWRNATFKDFDEDVEEYSDYHTIQGLPTAFNLTRYHNGDIVNQRFYLKVAYNTGLDTDLFDPAHVVIKKK